MPRFHLCVPFAWLGLALLPRVAWADGDGPDLAVVHRIKAEAFQRSQVMDHLFWLTDANGPRLTGSPGLRAAAEWAQKRLETWGTSKPRLEKWGKFGRGWSLERYSVNLLRPSYAPLGGAPLAWSRGTAGPKSGAPIVAPLVPRSQRADLDDPWKIEAHVARFMAEWKGKLAGKVVLLDPLRELEPPTTPASERFDDAALTAQVAAIAPQPLSALEWPLRALPEDPKKRAAFLDALPLEILVEFWDQYGAAMQPLWTFLRTEGAVAALMTDDRGEGGSYFVEHAGLWDLGAPLPPPIIVLPPETYDRLFRLAENKVPTQVELDVQVALHEQDPDGFNVIAELPGGARKDEVVMIGAHLDSWHAGTGAADNAAGAAVMLEVVRILRTLGLKLDRTVRLALWTGEEQGLHGSRGYVKSHFADPTTMALRPEHAKLSAYYNLDNGSGKVRGIYLQGNDMARPIFEAWLAPFHDLGAATVTIRNTDGTDHLSFDAVGLPGFQFIQDPLDYDRRVHHSNLDVAAHVQASDLMQASAVIASIVYQTATRKGPMPRKPLPAPLPPRRATRAAR